jgi:hypothetical protein
MKDPFFAEIDWLALERKELVPPTILCKEDNMISSDKTMRKKAEREKVEQAEAMLFEKDTSDEQRGG